MGKMNMGIRLFRNAGYTEPVYSNFRTEIIFQNSRLVKESTFIGSIVMSLLTISSFFVKSVSKVTPLYLITAIMFTAIFLLIRRMGSKNGTVTLICNYAFLLTAFFFAIGLDVIQNNPTATTVCVLLVALPLLIVDKPYRENLFFLMITLAFIFESVFIKQSPKASIDVLNAISFFVVGCFLGYKHNQMMLRNFMNQRLLENQRDTDTLTALYNKGAMENKVVSFLRKMDVTASMMVIDLDNFKYVNDTYGHQAGDEILVEIGHMLLDLFRSSDLISRFGGDEFIVFMPMMDNRKILEQKAQQILDGVSEIRIQEDAEYRAHICIGIAAYPHDGGSYEELFKNADEAMYRVKKNGKDGYGFF